VKKQCEASTSPKLAQIKEDFPRYTKQQTDFPIYFQLQKKNATTSMT
jgi:hypothetical protein